jgi:tRNA-intron endonuclease
MISTIKKTIIKGRKGREKPLLSGDRVTVFDEKLSGQLLNKSFGEAKRGKLSLSLYEACLLVEEGKLDIYDKNGKAIPLQKLMRIGEKLNEGFGLKYEVFSDLRESRGYVVKSGIKFGCDFVVYPRGKAVGKAHSKWMVHAMPEGARLDYSEFTRAARLATNVKKKMLFATVTERGPVYYEISRAKL